MLLINGSIFDGDKRLPAGQAVLVEDGRIRRIAPVAQFSGYAGRRIDVSGMTILPGLIDCHAHLTLGGELNPAADLGRLNHAELALRCLENALVTLRGGVTAIRDLGGVDYVEFAVRDACNTGRALGPTVRAAGRYICMTGGTNWFIGRQADGPDEVVKAVREQIHRGCDCVKLMATGGVLTPGVRLEHAQKVLHRLAGDADLLAHDGLAGRHPALDVAQLDAVGVGGGDRRVQLGERRPDLAGATRQEQGFAERVDELGVEHRLTPASRSARACTPRRARRRSPGTGGR